MKLTRLLSAAAAGLLAWSLSTAAVSQSPEQPDLATTQDPGLQGELNRIVDDNGWRRSDGDLIQQGQRRREMLPRWDYEAQRDPTLDNIFMNEGELARPKTNVFRFNF